MFDDDAGSARIPLLLLLLLALDDRASALLQAVGRDAKGAAVRELPCVLCCAVLRVLRSEAGLDHGGLMKEFLEEVRALLLGLCAWAVETPALWPAAAAASRVALFFAAVPRSWVNGGAAGTGHRELITRALGSAAARRLSPVWPPATQVVVRGFHADAGLWAVCPSTGEVYPRPSAYRMDSGAQLLEFLGEGLGLGLGVLGAPPCACGVFHAWARPSEREQRSLAPCALTLCVTRCVAPWRGGAGLMVGKALYEGILLNVAFAPFFVTRLQVSAWRVLLYRGVAEGARMPDAANRLPCAHGGLPVEWLARPQGRASSA